MNVIDLYESIRDYFDYAIHYDDLFYDAPEGCAQIEIIIEILDDLKLKLAKC